MAQAIAEKKNDQKAGHDRRGFLSWCTMLAGLVGGYGLFAALAARYLFPNSGGNSIWTFVTDLAGINVGGSMTYRTPSGQSIVITRLADEGTAADFIALSSVCPHLGCQVHWEGQNDRFFCPCHNGAFDAAGKAITGPPADAGQSLPQYSLQVENGLLFIEVPRESLA